jgi:hypothetical protein
MFFTYTLNSLFFSKIKHLRFSKFYNIEEIVLLILRNKKLILKDIIVYFEKNFERDFIKGYNK